MRYVHACQRAAHSPGHIADFSFLDENDEISRPQKVLLPTALAGSITKISTTNFSTACLARSGELVPFGAGCLGRGMHFRPPLTHSCTGNEFYDSNPLPIPFYSSINRRVTDVAMGGDLAVAVCSPLSGKEKNGKEVYIHGYMASSDGRICKSVTPCLVKHSLILDTKFCAVAQGNGAFSRSASFALIGPSVLASQRTNVLQIYGKRISSLPDSLESEAPRGALSFLQNLLVSTAARSNAADESARFKGGNQPPEYPFMQTSAELLEKVYQDPPVVSLEIDIEVKQMVLGEGIHNARP